MASYLTVPSMQKDALEKMKKKKRNMKRDINFLIVVINFFKNAIKSKCWYPLAYQML